MSSSASALSATPAQALALVVDDAELPPPNRYDYNHIERLVASLQEAKESLRKLEECLAEVDLIYRHKNPDLVSEMSRLMSELEMLNADAASESDSERAEDISTADSAFKHKRIKKRIKQLFHRISRLSHPDKLCDERFDPVRSELISCFLDAYKAYKNKDLVSLRIIYKAVIALREGLLNSSRCDACENACVDSEDVRERTYDEFIAECAELESNIRSANGALRDATQTRIYFVFKAHTQGETETADFLYRSALAYNIENLKGLIASRKAHKTQ